MDIITKLMKLGFSEAEASVYIELLKKPGQNGTQISKIIPLSRTSIYKALDSLLEKNMVDLIPSENENKNYNPINPKMFIENIKNEYNKILDTISFDLHKIYEPTDFLEVYNIVGVYNINMKIKYMIEESKSKIIISGFLDDTSIIETDKKIIRKNIERDEEFYCIIDDKAILIAKLYDDYPVAIYTKNKIIVSKYIGEKC